MRWITILRPTMRKVVPTRPTRVGSFAAIAGVAIRIRQTASRSMRGRPAPRTARGLVPGWDRRVAGFSRSFDGSRLGRSPPFGTLVLANRRQVLYVATAHFALINRYEPGARLSLHQDR